jgi:putative transposase
VTQRGNGRARTFFGEEDFALYRDLLAEHCRKADVEVWGWCLMPNHVHFILVPFDVDGLRRALAVVHRRFAGIIHARRRRGGHFWQGRFGAVAMDEDHLAAALRYLSLNRVRGAWSRGRRTGAARLRAAESVGRPLGDEGFLAWIERVTDRRLAPRKRGPKPRADADANGDAQLDLLSSYWMPSAPVTSERPANRFFEAQEIRWRS